MQRNTVAQTGNDAHADHQEAEEGQEATLGRCNQYGNKQQADQQIHHGTAHIIEHHRELAIHHFRRSHEALAAGACNLQSLADQFSILLQKHKAADPEGRKGITGEQAADQVAGFMDDNMYEPGKIQQEQHSSNT